MKCKRCGTTYDFIHYCKGTGVQPEQSNIDIAENIIAIATKIQSERDEAVRVIRFINDECDWEEKKDGGDNRINDVCEKFLSSLKKEG